MNSIKKTTKMPSTEGDGIVKKLLYLKPVAKSNFVSATFANLKSKIGLELCEGERSEKKVKRIVLKGNERRDIRTLHFNRKQT